MHTSCLHVSRCSLQFVALCKERVQYITLDCCRCCSRTQPPENTAFPIKLQILLMIRGLSSLGKAHVFKLELCQVGHKCLFDWLIGESTGNESVNIMLVCNDSWVLLGVLNISQFEHWILDIEKGIFFKINKPNKYSNHQMHGNNGNNRKHNH